MAPGARARGAARRLVLASNRLSRELLRVTSPDCAIERVLYDRSQIAGYILRVTGRIDADIDFGNLAMRIDEKGVALREFEYAEIAQ